MRRIRRNRGRLFASAAETPSWVQIIAAVYTVCPEISQPPKRDGARFMQKKTSCLMGEILRRSTGKNPHRQVRTAAIICTRTPLFAAKAVSACAR